MKFQVLAFGLLALLLAFGSDYYIKAQKSGKGLEEFGLAGYVESLKAGSSKAASETSTEAATELAEAPGGARSHLPESFGDWTRRAWQEGDGARFLSGDGQNISMEQLVGTTGGAGAFGGSGLPNRKRILAGVAGSSWIYERGDEAVLLQAELVTERPSRSLSGQMMQIGIGNMAAMTDVKGFAFVQGVGFAQTALFMAEDIEATPENLLTLNARIGGQQRVQITVRARARAGSIRELLAAIDYDAMNAMLGHPDPNVGSHMPQFDIAEQVALAEMGENERLAALSARGSEAGAAFVADYEEKGALGVALQEQVTRMGLGDGGGSPAAGN